MQAPIADDDDFFRLALAGILREAHGIGTVHEAVSFKEAAHAAGVDGFIPKTAGAVDISRALGVVMEGDIFVPASRTELTMKGASSRDIAQAFGLVAGRVKVHISNLFRALGVESRTAVSGANRKPALSHTSIDVGLA